jgi:hypothetical protein
MKHGYGVFVWESSNYYKGNYVTDQRSGYGEMFWNDGSIYKGQWVDGEQHGEGILYMADGRVKEGIFEKNRFIQRKKINLPNFDHDAATK